MQLTRFTDIGLRVLMRLASDDGATTRTARDLAAELELPRTHVSKVVSRLSEIGVVHSRRGRDGGLTITPLGRTARLGWLTRTLEGDDELVECTPPSGPCPLLRTCRLRGALARAQEAFYASLDTLTVADLTVPSAATAVLPLISRAEVARAGEPHGRRAVPSPTPENRNRS